MHKVSHQSSCFALSRLKGYRVLWHSTNFCPYNCSYCFCSSSPAETKVDSNSLAVQEYVKELTKYDQISELLITGGEPLSIIEDVDSMIRTVKRDGLTIKVSSTLMSEKLTCRLANMRPDVVNMSCNPRSPQIGDAPVKSNFPLIRSRATLLSEKNVPVKITSVLTNSNVEFLDECADFLKTLTAELSNIRCLVFQFCFPLGRGIDEQSIDIDRKAKAKDRIFQILSESTIDVRITDLDDELQVNGKPERVVGIYPNGSISLSPVAGIALASCGLSIHNTEPKELILILDQQWRDFLP